MKKVIFIILFYFVSFTLSSCAKGFYSQASTTANNCHIGMTIQEFKEISKDHAKLEKLEDGNTIYKMFDYNAAYGYVMDTKFFYFNSEGKLVKIDGGVRKDAPKQTLDLNIKNN
jgi:hypothetical protein